MKNSKSIKFIALLGGVVSLLSGCNGETQTEYIVPEEELTPVEINNLFEGMVVMYQTKNYTFNISRKEGSTNSKLSPLKFREDFVGYDGAKLADFDGTINDGYGLFTVSYDDDYLVSEYLETEDGLYATSLWDNTVVHTMYGVGGQFIKKYVTPQTESITITDKAYIIAFIQTLGYDSAVFANVNSLKANYVGGVVTFTLSLALTKTVTYTVKLEEVGTTTSRHLKMFKESGNKVFTPNEDLQEMRRLIKLDNLIHQIYSINDGVGSFIGYEFLTPNYFMSTGNSDTNAGAVYMEVEHEPDDLIDAEMSGIYLVAINKVMSKYEWSYSPNPINTTPNIEKCMHYPSFLKLLKNLQYVKEGDLRGSEYIFEDNEDVSRYYFTDATLVNDFANNFSLTAQFADCTPLAVSMELDLNHDTDKDKNIVFHYLMKYAGDGQTYDVILPLMWFGAANKPLCDQVYELLNNKTAANN